MEEPKVSVEVSIKLVDEGHYEFTTPYGPFGPDNGGDGGADQAHVQVVEGSSSVIAPGLSAHVA